MQPLWVHVRLKQSMFVCLSHCVWEYLIRYYGTILGRELDFGIDEGNETVIQNCLFLHEVSSQHRESSSDRKKWITGACQHFSCIFELLHATTYFNKCLNRSGNTECVVESKKDLVARAVCSQFMLPTRSCKKKKKKKKKKDF